MAFAGFTNLFALKQGFEAEAWRFLTAIFMHGSFAHLLSNLFALALFGTILEGFIGSRKFLAVFFASGVLANLIAVNFYSSSLGASGAIYGILGALVAIRPMMVVWVYGLPMPVFIAGIVWVIAGVAGLFAPSDIGHIAHLSGIGFGLVLGLIFRDWSKREQRDDAGKIIINEHSMRKWEEDYMR
jgi:membrane associated rhomboid family serine protease